MERSEEQLTGTQDNSDLLRNMSKSDADILYPHTDPSYFKDEKPFDQVKTDPKVSPYIKFRNLNEGDVDAPPKPAVDIGVKWRF